MADTDLIPLDPSFSGEFNVPTAAEAQLALFEEVLARDIATGLAGTPESVAVQQQELYGGVQVAVLEQVEPEIIKAMALPVGVAATILGYLAPGILTGAGVVAGWIYEAVSGLVDGYDGYDGYDGGGLINGGAAYMSNGVDLYGREGIVTNGGAVPVGGMGVPEPPSAMVAKQWKTKAFSKTAGEYWVYFFLLVDGRIMCWNHAKHQWKMWRPKKPLAVMYRGKTTLSQAIKVQSYLDKMWKNVAKRTKALKLA